MTAHVTCSQQGDHQGWTGDQLVEFLNAECEAAIASRNRMSKKIIELHAEIRMLKELVDPENVIQSTR